MALAACGEFIPGNFKRGALKVLEMGVVADALQYWSRVFPMLLSVSMSTHVTSSAAALQRPSDVAFALQEERQSRERRSKRGGAATSPANSLPSLLHVSLLGLHCKGRVVLEAA